jgi:hypothetical protein
MAASTNKSMIPAALLQWALPFLLSAFTAYGVSQYGRGAQAEKISTIETNVATVTQKLEKSTAEHANFPTREEMKLILDDLKEIKSDVREIRRSVTK